MLNHARYRLTGLRRPPGMILHTAADKIADHGPVVTLTYALGPPHTRQVDITLSIALNLAASGMWDGFKAIWQLIRQRIQTPPKAAEEQQITLTQVIYRSPDGSSMLCQQFSGSYDQIMEQSHAALQMYLPEFLGSAPEPENTPDEPPSATAE